MEGSMLRTWVGTPIVVLAGIVRGGREGGERVRGAWMRRSNVTGWVVSVGGVLGGIRWVGRREWRGRGGGKGKGERGGRTEEERVEALGFLEERIHFRHFVECLLCEMPVGFEESGLHFFTQRCDDLGHLAQIVDQLRRCRSRGMDCRETDFQHDIRDERFVRLFGTFGVIHHPLQQIHRLFAGAFPLLHDGYKEVAGEFVVVFDFVDFGDEFGDEGAEDAGVFFEFLGGRETVDGEGDGGVDPFGVLAELLAAEHAARDSTDELGEFLGDGDLGPFYACQSQNILKSFFAWTDRHTSAI